MKRRSLAAGGLGVLTGGGTVAALERADIVLRPGMYRARGEPATISFSQDTESEESESDERGTESYPSLDRWAEVEGKDLAAERTPDILTNRFDRAVDGITTGVQYLLFGAVISIENTTMYDRDGDVIGKPTVSTSDLIKKAPKSIEVRLESSEKTYQSRYPVVVGTADIQRQ